MVNLNDFFLGTIAVKIVVVVVFVVVDLLISAVVLLEIVDGFPLVAPGFCNWL